MIKTIVFVIVLIGFYQSSIAQIMLGFGGSYGDDIQQFAPNFRVYYFPNHKICFGPEFAHFPRIKEREQERELTEYGFTGHYIFNVNERVGVFPLVGLNYAIERERELDQFEEESSFGLNIGGGIHIEYDRYFPYVEYKYVASRLAQSVFSIGVLININEPVKEENNH